MRTNKRERDDRQVLLPPVDVLERRLREALEKLPFRGDGKLSDYPGLAVGDIHHLLVCRPVKHSSEIIKYQNRFGMVGKATTKREIENFKSAAEKLLHAIMNLHAPARIAMKLDASTEEIMKRQAAGYPAGIDLEMRIRLAIVHAEHYEMPEFPANAGRGRKAASQETRFAYEIGKIFTSVTGRVPGITTDPDTGKRSGPYLTLVSDVFEIFRVNASPLVHAKAAARLTKEELAKMKKFRDSAMQEIERNNM